MVKTITQLDLTRSILWEHESPKDRETCNSLTKLFLWLVEGKIYAIGDTDIAVQLTSIANNLNKNREVSRAITKIQIVKRERVDDLIIDEG